MLKLSKTLKFFFTEVVKAVKWGGREEVAAFYMYQSQCIYFIPWLYFCRATVDCCMAHARNYNVDTRE